MADDLKYGYKGAEPTQSFGNNTGVFDPNDINNLIADNKWTTFGQLELIETKTVSAVSSVDFETLGSYNVHFLTWNDLKIGTSAGNYLQLRFSNNGGTSYIASGYQVAMQYGGNNGSFGDTTRSTSANSITYLSYSNTTTSNANQNGYLYLYNLLDSSKYSFLTSHSFNQSTSTVAYFYFGSGVLPTAETHNAFQLLLSGGATISGTISLYGIRYS